MAVGARNGFFVIILGQKRPIKPMFQRNIDMIDKEPNDLVWSDAALVLARAFLMISITQ